MKEAKPIICIGYYGMLNQEMVEEVRAGIKVLEQKMPDYHIIFYFAFGETQNIKIQVFYDKDVIEKELKEIQEMILEEMRK